jgi:hypothetical protein
VLTINNPKTWIACFSWSSEHKNAISAIFEARCCKTNPTVVSAIELGQGERLIQASEKVSSEVLTTNDPKTWIACFFGISSTKMQVQPVLKPDASKQTHGLSGQFNFFQGEHLIQASEKVSLDVLTVNQPQTWIACFSWNFQRANARLASFEAECCKTNQNDRLRNCIPLRRATDASIRKCFLGSVDHQPPPNLEPLLFLELLAQKCNFGHF